MLESYGEEIWFKLGDRDLATHILRTERIRSKETLTEVTAGLSVALGVESAVLPMSDDPVSTILDTPEGRLEFQEYFVRRGQRDEVLGIELRGIQDAGPTERVLAAIGADAIVLCPSNPVVSIGPILALPGMTEALEASSAPKVAVSQIVGGRALKVRRTDARLARPRGLCPGVARMYAGLVDGMVIDRTRRGRTGRHRGPRDACSGNGSVMRDAEDRARLASRRWSLVRDWWRDEHGQGRVRRRACEGLAGHQESPGADPRSRRQGRANPVHDGPCGACDRAGWGRGRVCGQPRPNGSAGGEETRRNTARPGEPRAQSRPRRGPPPKRSSCSPQTFRSSMRLMFWRSCRRRVRDSSVVISPDGMRSSTNALLIQPSDVLPSPSGRQLRGTLGLRACVAWTSGSARQPHLAFDLDTAGDLTASKSRGSAPVRRIEVLGVEGFPEVRPGDDLNRMISDSVGNLRTGDVLVVTHKIVSKAEGRLIDLRTVEPSTLAKGYATRFGKDPRQIEVVLRESRRIVRMDRGIVISETHHGFVCANAGVDSSNVPATKPSACFPWTRCLRGEAP